MSQQAERKESGYAKHPDYDVHFERSPKRVRAVFNGETIADSLATELLFESRHIPVYYFPRADVRMDLLQRTEHSTYCPFKGDAAYWSVNVGGRTAENAVWSYEAPYPQTAEIKDYVAFYWNRMDHWYEEDEEVFVHARDPYKRIDIVRSKRPVKVVLGGHVVAESDDARFLFETGLPTRYYLPRGDVDMSVLAPSDTATQCPYKGTAQYWSAEIDGESYPDIVWAYPDPIPEAGAIEDLLCFFNEQVDAIFVDGVEQPRPKTKWSKR
tara:strand:+ start:168 stop:971 length:804 start_codon:yes stop_codon:yes gene_type:complete